jgi:hypothetical protein
MTLVIKDFYQIRVDIRLAIEEIISIKHFIL